MNDSKWAPKVSDVTNIDSKWASKVSDVTNIDQTAGQVLKHNKRALAMSPSTPVGIQRKHVVDGNRMSRNLLTFGEDIEMFDLEQGDQDTGTENNSPVRVGVRRTATGLRRRHLGLELSAGAFSLDGVWENTRDHTGTKHDGIPDNLAQKTRKGTSVKSLRLKARNNKTNKERKSYKSTRKKKHQDIVDKDRTQSLISNFFHKIPNNSVIVGNDGGNSDVYGPDRGPDGVLDA